MSHRPSSYERILDAAEKVVLEVGASHMTLCAVAKKAGLSKGGLLYHFPSKDDLLKAMIQRLAERLRQTRYEKMQQLQGESFPELKAYVLSSLYPSPELDNIFAAILAAISHNPKLLKLIREEYQKFLQELSKSVPSFFQMMRTVLAVDGLRLIELLRLSPFSQEQRTAIIAEILKNIDESSTTPTMEKLSKLATT